MGFLDAAGAITEGDFQAATDLMLRFSKAYYAGVPAMTDAEWDLCCESYRECFGRDFKAPRLDRRAASAQAYPNLANFIEAELHGEVEFLAWYEANRPYPDAKRGEERDLIAESVLLGSPKYDGISVTIEYDSLQRVVSARTRGDDGLGVDVTSMFEGELHWALEFEVGGKPFGVKYEAVMTWADLDAMNKALMKAYKNPRNTVAGAFASDDKRARRPFIVLAPLDIEFEGMPESRFERIELLEACVASGGFTANEVAFVKDDEGGGRRTPWWWEPLWSPAEAMDFVGRVEEWRKSCGYMIDGAVLEFGQASDIARLGGRSQAPRWLAKYKFPAAVAKTRAVSLEWDLGATGRATPCVNFEPVVLNGNTYSRTSIANMARFDKLKLCPGTPLRFELRNDVNNARW
jgi:NAD-dependent DNA ligase